MCSSRIERLAGDAQQKMSRIAFENAAVVTLDHRGVLQDQTVLISDGRIARIAAASSCELDPSIVRIDGRGRFLMPGLCDMHVHIGLPLLEAGSAAPDLADLYEDAASELPLYLANGVTTVRNMSGAAFHVRLADDVRNGLRPGPHIASTSPILDGIPPVWSFGVPVVTRADARAAVDKARAAGFVAMKVYNRLSLPAYRHLVEAASEAGLPVVGHVPFDVGLMGCLEARQSSIEHFRGYDIAVGADPWRQTWIERAETWLDLTPEVADRYIAATVEAGTLNCPTFTVLQSAIRAAGTNWPKTCLSDAPPALGGRMDRFRRGASADAARAAMVTASFARQRAFAFELHRANQSLLIGTDAGINDIMPGSSLHDELETFVQLGLSPVEALACCTRAAAGLLGAEQQLGVVSEGAIADLVLLDADPTLDIRNARKVRGTMVGGRYHVMSLETLSPGPGFPAREVSYSR